MFPNIDEQLYDLFRQMENDKYMMAYTSCPFTKELYRQKLMNTMDMVTSLITVQARLYKDYQQSYKQKQEEITYSGDRQRKFTLEELAQYDGSRGKPAYAAVDGIVYDVSNNAAWGGGTHFGLIAGKDLTQAFEGCHDAKTILNKLPVVGTLVV